MDTALPAVPLDYATFTDALLTFSPPVPTTAGYSRPGALGVLADGTVYFPYVNQANSEIRLAYTPTPGSAFTDAPLDSSPFGVGNLRAGTDHQGRLHVAWYHNLPEGETVIYYARRDPGTAPGTWAVGPHPIGSARTGPATGGGHKVVGLATAGNLVYVCFGRNGVGARVVWSADGRAWSPVQIVPGSDAPHATDFNCGATVAGHFAVGWFGRAPTPDVFVVIRAPGAGAHWGAVTDISAHPNAGQDYSPRFAAAPDGSLRVVWQGNPSGAQPSTDGYTRVWTPAGGWAPSVVRLWATAGQGHSRGCEVLVDATGTVHLAWDDDTGRPAGAVATLYTRGAGTQWSTPVNVAPTLGANSANRFPALALGAGRVWVGPNSNASGVYKNYVVSTPL